VAVEKKKNGRTDSRSNNRTSEKKTRGGGGGPRTLVLPHSKLTIRRIHNVEKFGTADQMADLLREMFLSASTNLAETANSSPTEYSVVLDEISLQRCCKKSEARDEKESIDVEQREQLQGELPQDHPEEGKAAVNTENDFSTENTVNTKEIDSSSEKEVLAKKKDQSTENKVETKDNVSSTENLVVTDESESLSSSQEKEKENIHILITTKTLYLVPPRKSRRRGIITGNIYLVLNPTIKSTPYKKMSNFERSKTVATARLALQSFQTILATSASNTTTPTIVLERSANQKTFYTDKHHIHRTPRSSLYEGSIFQTEDYQAFMQQRLQFQEDLKNRPKPQPGGGFLDSVSTTSIMKEDSKEEKKDLPQSKQTVSALVLYLQKKKEMTSYKKKSAMKLNSSSKSSKRKKKKEIKNSGQGTSKSKKDFKKKGASNASSSAAAGSKASNPMTIAPRAIIERNSTSYLGVKT